MLKRENKFVQFTSHFVGIGLVCYLVTSGLATRERRFGSIRILSGLLSDCRPIYMVNHRSRITYVLRCGLKDRALTQCNFKRLLKAYSQISNRGRFQKIQNLNFLQLFIALLLKTLLSEGIEDKSFQGEIRAIFP